MSSQPTVVALIPARAGSKRIKNKNILPLGVHPLIAYSISSALQSKIYKDVVVCTDSTEIAQISEYYGAQIPFLRPIDISGDVAPDIEWVEFALGQLSKSGHNYEVFSILRPTSPFRQAATIQRAWFQFLSNKQADSLRAVEKCKQHPGKMWIMGGTLMEPLLKEGPTDVPWHSTPYQGLPPVYAQNASLEMAWTRVVKEGRTIAGKNVMPFLTEGFEGLDINEEKDFWYARHLLETGNVTVPPVAQKPYSMGTKLEKEGVK